jgi:hypothetical protein
MRTEYRLLGLYLTVSLFASFALAIVTYAVDKPSALQKVKENTAVENNALMKKMSVLQMPFIENQGQVKDKSVRFCANTFAGKVFVTDKGEIVYRLIKTEKEDTEFRMQDTGLRKQKTHNKDQDPIRRAVALRETLIGSKQANLTGMHKSKTRVNYFKGKKEDWRTDIPTWQELSLGEIYKGIDLKLKAYGKTIEKLFTVHPEGSVTDIKLSIEGAKGLKIKEDGVLEVETDLGVITFTKPVAYQEIKGKRIEVAANYIIPEPSTLNPQPGLSYGFKVARYDKTKPLVIDPLLASTFIGGDSLDAGNALALDASGNVYVAGDTIEFTTDYPTTPGAYNETHNGNTDVFVSKLDSNLTTLLASTFIGGDSVDSGYALALDASGNLYVSGFTGDGTTDYPTTPGAYDETHNGWRDVFVSKLDSNLTTLLASTFIGGDGEDYGYWALALDASGNVYVAGNTQDGTTDYPTTPGAYDETHNGLDDVFVSKLDSNLTTLSASTFIGGDSVDYAWSLALDASGNVFVAGRTLDGTTDYPTTPGAYDETYNGGFNDGFVSKLDSNLTTLSASTFIGGDSVDSANALALDASFSINIHRGG